MTDDSFDGFDDFEEYEDFEPVPLDDHESALVRQDLIDLMRFEGTFSDEGYRGVSVYCPDCAEEHYYPWDMLRMNLETLLETGETPVHEQAYAPDPEEYIPWDYARGYVDALRDVGADERLRSDACPRCNLLLEADLALANFCPRCGTVLASERLRQALESVGLDAEAASTVLRRAGFPDPTLADGPEVLEADLDGGN